MPNHSAFAVETRQWYETKADAPPLQFRLLESRPGDQSQNYQGRLELGLRLSSWFGGANNLDCRRTSRRRKAVRCACRWKAHGVCWTGNPAIRAGVEL